ncbi:MAG: response regulator transcription factor, partial [Cyanobacteria bacterium]|nr:response regulator transcription factor [Cyanobacteriota bacterium]
WEMPEMSGIQFIEKFRARGKKAPVIMLTGKSATDDKISGLDCGADYYLTKPFERKGLLAFIRASLRRSPEPESGSVHFGNLEFKPVSSEAICDGHSVTLSSKEAVVLKLFIDHSDRLITHKELEVAGWSGSDVSSGTIRTFLTGLREKLQSIGANTKISSVRGYGYRIESNS